MNYKQLNGKSIREAFKAFHKDNPRVYALFEQQVGRRKDFWRLKHGGTLDGLKISAKAIINWLRWECHFSTTDQDFKINDAFHAYYARLHILIHPEDEPYFELRKLRNEEPGPFMAVDPETKQLSFL